MWVLLPFTSMTISDEDSDATRDHGFADQEVSWFEEGEQLDAAAYEPGEPRHSRRFATIGSLFVCLVAVLLLAVR